MNGLEMEFHRRMLDICDRAKSQCNYNATRFRQMISELGGVETAHRLLATNESQDGFTTLLICGCSDLTMEHLVLDPQFADLFTEEERQKAKDRLGK